MHLARGVLRPLGRSAGRRSRHGSTSDEKADLELPRGSDAERDHPRTLAWRGHAPIPDLAEPDMAASIPGSDELASQQLARDERSVELAHLDDQLTEDIPRR